MTSLMSLFNVMYFHIIVGPGANKCVIYLWVYEPTSKMHGVNIRA